MPEIRRPRTAFRRRALAVALAICALTIGMLAASAPSSVLAAADVCVNPGGTDGCFSSINAAVVAVDAGGTITVRAGSYAENVVIDKPLTLKGNSNAVIHPAISSPNPCSGSSLCSGLASNIVLVQADNVTISGLTLDGDNSALTSGVVRGGADLDARNGIITNHAAGVYQNLVVSRVTIQNIYLRGAYASTTGGTFTFDRNTVRNVQGDAASIGMFNFGGSGQMTGNNVSDANDAIAANWSRGTQLLNNRVTRSGSGVHTDNNGGQGGVADRLQGNRVTDCMANGYGVWVFVPYVAPTVQDNTVTGCDVGLAHFGQADGVPAGTVTAFFIGNKVTGTGGPGTVGAYITTTDIGFGPFNVNASLSNNSIRRFETGVYVQQDGGKTGTAALDGNTVTASGTGIDVDAASATANNGCIRKNSVGLLVRNGGTATAHQNAIAKNSAYGAKNDGAAGPVDATQNWWGAADGPAPAGHGDLISAGVDATPFLAARPHGACGGDGDDDQEGGSDHQSGEDDHQRPHQPGRHGGDHED